MRSKQPEKLLRLVVLVLSAGLLLVPIAQGQTSSGGLTGVVTDETGGVLPGAAVTVLNAARGFTRVAVTGNSGGYRFPNLPIGTYSVKVEISGFAPVTVEGVEIYVAVTRELPITMKLAAVAESLTVTAEAPLIAATPSVGTVVSQGELENLPLNGRQFANLAALAPGTTLAYNTDPTKPGQLTIQLVGGNGRNVNFLMDGGDNTDDTIGGALQNFSLEAVQEFNIQTMQYKAEYGRSSGGVLSVVTKTGSNQFKGSVYGFFRKDSLNTRTETERLAGIDKQAYDRKQYGLAFGGPIVKDKVHFFLTYEQTDRSTNYTVSTGGLFPTYDGQVVTLPFKDKLVSGKVTYDISVKQYLQVRYGYQKNDDKYGASALAAPNGLGTISNKYESMLLGHTMQIGADALNEFVFQYSKFNNAITSDSQEPLIYYPSGFHTGQNLNTPQTTNQTKYQYKDDFSFSKEIGGARHDFKTGLQFINEPTLGGEFGSGLAGQYTTLEDRIGSPITLIQYYSGFFGDSTPTKQYGAYFQDDWYISRNVTLNLGLRYDYFDALRLDQRSNAIYQVLSTQTTYNESYLQDFRGWNGITENEKNDWSPRLGMTWDIKGNARHILRAGWGRFYDFPYSNATILFPAAYVQSNYGLSYQVEDTNGILNPDGSWFQPGDPLPPNQLPSQEGTAADEIASPTLAPPYSDQASIGYSWQVNDWLGINMEAVSVKFHQIPFRFRINVIDPATGQRRWPQFGSFRLWYGNGSAEYQGVNIGGRIRKDRFELQGFYTWSKAEGNVLSGADEFRLTPNEYQADIGGGRDRRDQSVDPLDPLCDACWGPLYTDARHRVTLGAMYRVPWDIVVSGMLRYRSAVPYLEHANCDLNGDGSTIDLAPNGGTCPASGLEMPAASSVNTGRGFSFTQFDIRLSKEFKLGGDFGVELIAEVFNVFNKKNAARPNRYGEASNFAGDPGQGEQRLAQLGLRVSF